MEKQKSHIKPSRKTDMSHESFEEVKKHIDGFETPMKNPLKARQVPIIEKYHTKKQLLDVVLEET